VAFTIDVHHHILPDVFWRATNDAHNPVGGISPAPWSRESTLSYIDDAGIDVAITPISTPGVHMGDDAAARDRHPANLRMPRSVAGVGQVLFGSDYPYLRRDLAVSCRQEVESSAELQANEAYAVLVGNALKLFPRFAGHAANRTTNAA
jgi:hypothetical protein